MPLVWGYPTVVVSTLRGSTELSIEEIIKIALAPLSVLLIGAGIIYLLKKPQEVRDLKLIAVEKVANDTKKQIDAHEIKCDEVPNIWIKSKLEELCEKQDAYHTDMTKRLDLLDKALDKGREKLEKHGLAIQRIETKLNI